MDFNDLLILTETFVVNEGQLKKDMRNIRRKKFLYENKLERKMRHFVS